MRCQTIAFALAFPLMASSPPYQGYIGEAMNGPLYIYDWSVPSFVTFVKTPFATLSGRRSAWGLALSPNSNTLYVGDSDSNQIMVFDAGTLTFAGPTLSAGAGRTRGLAMGPTGKFLYVARRDTTGTTYFLDVINVSLGVLWASIPLNSRPNRVAVAPNNSRVVVTLNSNQAAVIKIAGSLHSLLGYVTLAGPADDVVISPNSKWAVLPVSSAGRVSNFNLATLAVNAPLNPACAPTSAAFSPAGTRLYLACYSSNRYLVFNWTSGALIKTGTFPPAPPGSLYFGPNDVSVTPDGKFAWFRGEPYGVFFILDTTTFTLKFLPGLVAEHAGEKILFGKPHYFEIDSFAGLGASAGIREAAPAPCAPGQVFRVTAKWRNNSTNAWTDVFAEVNKLTGGNSLISQSWDLGADGVVNPGESAGGVFRISLASCAQFSFEVSLAAASREAAAGGRVFRGALRASDREEGEKEDESKTAPRLDPGEDGALTWTLDPR